MTRPRRPVSADSVATLVVRTGRLCEPVVERVIGALAARIDLPVDRLADAQIVGEAIAAYARRHSPDGVLTLRFGAAPGCLVIRLGPLDAGAAERLLAETAVRGVGPVIERVVDEWSVAEEPDGERLRLVIGGTAGAAAG